MISIDAGAGMKSADIPDGFGYLPDRGKCPSCSAGSIRLKKDGTLFQHWQYGWSRRNGHGPCGGSGSKPTVLNESRVIRYLAEQRAREADTD